jgi:hypothetical protein
VGVTAHRAVRRLGEIEAFLGEPAVVLGAL